MGDAKIESFEDPWVEDWTSIKRAEPQDGDLSATVVAGVQSMTEYDNIGESATKTTIRQYLQSKSFDRDVWMTVLHNSATPASADTDGLATVKSFSNYHVYHNGWKAIGYHFVIDIRGTIWAARKMGLIGAHAGPAGNPGSIGVCLTGNFEESDVPTQAQKEAFAALHTALCDLYYGGASRKVRFHREFMETACPGKITVEGVMGWVSAYTPSVPPVGASIPIYDEKMIIRGQASVIGNTSYTPLRKVFEAMGFKVDWVASKFVANMTSPGKTPIPVGAIYGTADKPKIVVDGKQAAAGMMINNVTNTPVRATFEAAGYKVEWKSDGVHVSKL